MIRSVMGGRAHAPAGSGLSAAQALCFSSMDSVVVVCDRSMSPGMSVDSANCRAVLAFKLPCSGAEQAFCSPIGLYNFPTESAKCGIIHSNDFVCQRCVGGKGSDAGRC